MIGYADLGGIQAESELEINIWMGERVINGLEGAETLYR